MPSGSLQVRVYASVDPLSGRRNILLKTVPVGHEHVGRGRGGAHRLLNQVDGQRSPRTRATVRQLMARHLELLKADETMRRS